MIECEKPLWSEPMGIFKNFSLRYVPECPEQIWNYCARLILIALVFGIIGSPICGYINATVIALSIALIIGFVVIMTTPVNKTALAEEKEIQKLEDKYKGRWKVVDVPVVMENFTSGGGMVTRVMGVEATLPEIDSAPYSGPSLPAYTPPSSRNPFMNILIDEYKYNPDRASAAPVNDPSVKQTLDDYFRVQWFSDPTDVFGKNQSQRQFVTQPSTSIPNDRESYQNWLYKIPGKTCKEGGRAACLAGTDGGPVTWLNMDS